jgi:hypothetical protein
MSRADGETVLAALSVEERSALEALRWVIESVAGVRDRGTPVARPVPSEASAGS